MELCVVRHKVKTNHVEKHLGNSDTEDSRTNEKCLCFDVCAFCLSSTMESSRLYMWWNLVESRWYPTASSARICHLCTVGLASSNGQLSKLFTHYISTLIKNRVGDDGVLAILQYRPSDYIWRIGRKLWQFCKKIPTPLSHLQIRPSLVHPFLSQDKILI